MGGRARAADLMMLDLRRKMEPDPGAAPGWIRTVRNAGYIYVPAR